MGAMRLGSLGRPIRALGIVFVDDLADVWACATVVVPA